MINPILKFKINNNIKISAKEILKYINVENLDSTSKSFQDNYKYIYNNFDKILNILELKEIITIFNTMFKTEDINHEFHKVVHDNFQIFSNKINNLQELYDFFLPMMILKVEHPEEIKKILDGNLFEFCENIDKRNLTHEFGQSVYECFDDTNLHFIKISATKEFFEYCLRKQKISKQDMSTFFRCYFSKNNVEVLEKNLEFMSMYVTCPIEFLSELRNNWIDKIDISTAENIIKNRKKAVIKELSNTMENNPKNQDIAHAQRKTEELIGLIIDDILKHENKTMLDIKHIGDGAYLRAYKIGSKVLKIGNELKKYELPQNSKLFLKPILRHNFETVDDYGNTEIINITCSEEVDTQNITDEDLYKVYKELRDSGMIWLDAHKGNIGRLKKDNRTYFNVAKDSKNKDNYIDLGEVIYKPNIGFPDEENDDIAKAGDLVIIDLDFIYQDTEEYRRMQKSTKSYDLELRYQSELIKKTKSISDSKKENNKENNKGDGDDIEK